MTSPPHLDPPATPSLRFGRFELRLAEQRLFSDGVPVKLGTRAFDVLSALIQRRDRVVTKSELLDLVWPNRVVEENNLEVQISSLRKVIGADAIVTVASRGYRFGRALDLEPGAPFIAEGPASSDQPAHTTTNIPASVEQLIEREGDIAAVDRLLVEHRMITVVGTGGIGKTRLAQAVATASVGRYRNGVWWVDLSALAASADIVPAIAAAARLSLGAGESPAQLGRLLAARDTLIVLDNCEHLAAEVAATAHAILTAAPAVRLLATSQHALRLEGEYCYRLDALSVPPRGTPLEIARTFGAVQLLEKRAQAIDRHFTLRGSSGEAAVELCRELDGIALAIEMAASRLPTLGAEALRSSLAALGNTSRTAPERQRTMRAMLEWSYSLLNPFEQALLRRLAVFAGGFRIDIAQRVATGDMDGEFAVLEALSSLVDRSLVQVESREPLRHRLLETMRSFAAEQLTERGEARVAAQAHGLAMLWLADEAERTFWSTSRIPWLSRYAPDYADLQAAFDHAIESRDAEIAATCGEAMLLIDLRRGISAPSRRRIDAALGLIPLAGPVAQARLWNCATGWESIIPGQLSRLDAVNARVLAWQRVGDRSQIHQALGLLAVEEARAGNFDAADAARNAMTALDDPRSPLRQRWQRAWCSAEICAFRGDTGGMAVAYREGLAIAECMGDDDLAQSYQIKLAEAALMSEDPGKVLALTRPLINQLRTDADVSRLAAVLERHCAASVLAGDLAAASAVAIEIVLLHQQMDSIGWAFNTLSLLASRSGYPAIGAQLLGCADAWLDANAMVRQPVDSHVAKLAATAIDAAIGTAARTRLHTDGRALSAVRAHALAIEVGELPIIG